MDGSKTIVTPDHVYFRMREATFLNDPEYNRLKTPQLTPSIDERFKLTEAELKWIEHEKDRRFQLLFNELWPNLHSKLDEQTNAQKLAAEIEKNKKLNELLLEQELAKLKAKKEEEMKTQPPLPSIYSSIYTPRCHDSVNITLQGLANTTGGTKSMFYGGFVFLYFGGF